MSYDYTRSRAAARSLLARYGQDVTLRRTLQGTYDSATGSFSGGSSTDYAARAVVSNYQDGTDGGTIQTGDRHVLMAADGLAVEPAPPATGQTDSLIIEGETFQIVRVRTIRPGEANVLYDIHARR